MKITREQTSCYTTKDGSKIRELLHPDATDIKNQSLAEASVGSGETTAAHFHCYSEEIYYILKGSGKMFLDKEAFTVNAGDSILIRPGQQHCIENTGKEELRFLCCCAPAYRHDDTFLI
ncbi:MAG: cupin domain-containing protein [Gammaproteobacteria bacterium]|nr:cupin domain-containing protein [Gammaproteobacteria bacterium]